MKRTFRLLKEIPGLDKKVGESLTIEAEKISYRELSTVEYDPATRPDLWEEIKENFKTKKYKLIKTYPGSPKTIGLQIHQNGPFWQSNFAIDNVEHFHIDTKFNPQDYPEFWQKIIENDYEILEWSYGYNREYKTKNPDGTASNYEVYSIKRLSDGEIFTIGDFINAPNIHNKPITNILEEGIICWNDISRYILTVEKSKPLFKTEDGVDMFIGNKYCRIHKPSLKICNKIANKLDTTDGSFICFSTKEKAEEYIYHNKPRFSFKDIELAYDKSDTTFDEFPSLSQLISALEKHCL